jgi:hypothetical protein
MKFSFTELAMIREAVQAAQTNQQAWIAAANTTAEERAMARTKLVTINRILDKFNDDA